MKRMRVRRLLWERIVHWLDRSQVLRSLISIKWVTFAISTNSTSRSRTLAGLPWFSLTKSTTLDSNTTTSRLPASQSWCAAYCDNTSNQASSREEILHFIFGNIAPSPNIGGSGEVGRRGGMRQHGIWCGLRDAAQ